MQRRILTIDDFSPDYEESNEFDYEWQFKVIDIKDDGKIVSITLDVKSTNENKCELLEDYDHLFKQYIDLNDDEFDDLLKNYIEDYVEKLSFNISFNIATKNLKKSDNEYDEDSDDNWRWNIDKITNIKVTKFKEEIEFNCEKLKDAEYQAIVKEIQEEQLQTFNDDKFQYLIDGLVPIDSKEFVESTFFDYDNTFLCYED